MSQTVTLTFTGRDGANRHVPMNRVVVTNLTRGWQETLVWPDTVLTMQNGVGIHDVETQNIASLQLSQNNPNPFNGATDVLLTALDAGAVTLEIADANGRMVEKVHAPSLQPAGTHQFRITLCYLENLLPNTTYHVSAYAINSVGSSMGMPSVLRQHAMHNCQS